MNYKENAKLFKALSDESRLEIIDILGKTGEVCACKFLDYIEIGQSTLSHHLKILTDAEIIKGRKEGKWIHYFLNKKGLNNIKEILDKY